METVCIFLALLSVASAQLYHPVPLKEARHLQAIQQPHLPQDQNVLAATQQFLNRFAQLKALADAAPDPPVHQNRQAATHQLTNHLAGHQAVNVHGQVVPIYVPQQQQLQHQQVHPRQASHHVVVPVVNHHGIVINPNRYPGPLAHNLPANVG